MKGISLVLSGEAGLGIKTVETLLTELLLQSGFHVFLSKEYMSRIRGGNNTTQIRIAETEVCSFTLQTDIVVVLNKNALHRLENRITSDTLIIGNLEHIAQSYRQNGYKVCELPLKQTAATAGGQLYINSVILGLLASLFKIEAGLLDQFLEKRFEAKGQAVIAKNNAAAAAGAQLAPLIPFTSELSPKLNVSDYSLLSGTEAVCIGALAGGCNFVTAYPMSPSTGVLVYMATNAHKYGMIVEQAEGEIGAINMVVGAWYAGARAMTTTSGGGFALMGEGLSLAGITETPAVIHLAQRPGPATGLPTRTEQGDLNQAVYGGHGEFPRIVFAPGTLEEAIRLTHRAFNLADQYQVPAIILTDQYFLDQMIPMKKFSLKSLTTEKYVTETKENYLRYKLTDNGISPRGIPGLGKGLVCADSDEHDEEGRITEDFDQRIAMNDKRLKKLDNYQNIPIDLIGPSEYAVLAVSWGSTYGAVKEALEYIKDTRIAFAHCSQVFPVPEELKDLMANAPVSICIENNATGQFADLVQLHTGQAFTHRCLKYNGLPFAVEEIVQYLEEALP